MKKIYKLIVLAVLLCCGTSLWAAQSLPYSYGFEDYDLSTDGWTKYFGTSLTNNNNECAIVGDAKKTGSYGFRFSSYNTSGANAQYLISPELDAAAGLDLTFWYKASDSRGTEKFKVGYSTTDADVANFTWGEENSTNSTSWLKFEGSFPAGTKYVAIYYYANYQYRLYVDDFEFVGKAEGPALQVLDGLTKITSGHNYSFGLATAGSVKMFTMSNPGTEAATITVSHTGDFTVTPSTTISIPAGESSALAIYMPETSGSDVITISSTAEGIDDFVINVSGTIRDASKMWCNFSEGLPEGWTNSSYTINTTGAGAGTSDGGYAGNTNYSDYRLSTPKVAFAENEKMFLLVAGYGSTASWNSMKVQYSSDGANWTDAKSVANIAKGSWTSVEVTEIPAGSYYIGFYGKYYYITDIYGGTLAAMPKNVTASGITDTEATISWTAHGSETAWQVSYSTTSGDPDNGTIVNADATSKTITGLSATTTYYVAVRIGDSGEWSNEISFTTECGATIAPYTWTFDGLSDGTVPNCWDNSGSETSTTGSYLWSVYKIYNTTKYMLRLYNSMVKNGTALINTPRIVLPASPAYEFAFDYSHKASCGAFTVKVSEDGGANWTDLQSYTNETGGNATSPDAELIEASIDLSSFAGKTIMMQFFATADYDAGAIFVDNVAVRVKSSCPAPKNPTISAITANTASVAWTEKGEATAWKLQTSTDGSNWGDEIAADANPFTLTGLTAETTYYVRVKAVCSESESSDWSDASEAFTTQCEAKSLPFATEGFDAIPACWSVDPEWELYSYDGSIRVKSSTADLTMPAITLSEKAQLSFKHSAGSNSVKCYVYVNDGEKEEKAGEVASSTSWKQATVDLAYTGKTVNIIFRSSSSSYFLYLDDVAVNYLPVAAPTNFVATPANASAVVTWESDEEGAKFALRYRTNGEGDWTEVANIEEKTYTINSLTNSTAYEVQVKAIASANRQSDWTASAVVTPVSCASVETVTFGDKTYNSVVVNWTTTGAGTWNIRYKTAKEQDWTVVEGNIAENTKKLEGLTPGEVYTIAVKPSCNDGEEAWVATAETYTPLYTAPTNVKVTGITETTASASWDAVADAPDGYLYVVSAKDAEPAWNKATQTAELTATLSDLEAATEYDLHVVTKYGQYYSSDSKVSFTTSTVAPKNLTAGEITTTTATFSWENDGTATKYQWSTDSTNWSDAQTELTATATGLTAGTSYTFYVRSYYAEGKYSAAIKQAFSTECAVKSLPFGIESFSEGKLPACWSAASQWAAYTYDGNSMRFNASTTADLTLPAIALNDKAQLTFRRQSTYVSCAVYVNDGESETKLADFAASSSWALSTVDLSDYAGKTVSIIIRGNYYGSNRYLYIDDVAVDYKPVAAPTNLTATPADASAVITWESDEEGAKFALRYRTNGEGDWTEVANIEEKTYTIESLTNGTAYEVQVKAVASANRQSDWTASAVVTPVSCASVETVTFGEKTYNSVVVNWTTTGAGTWNIRYKTAKEQDWTVVEGNIAENTKKLEGLTPGEVYTIAVKPSCNDGEEAWVATAETYTPLYTAPTNVKVTGITETTASASWDAVADAPDGYLYVVSAKDAEPAWNKATQTAELTATLSDLEAATEYDLHVVTKYGQYYSSDSKFSFTTSTIAPKNLTAGEITTTTATFTWEANGAATQYQWSTDNTNWSDAQTELTATATGLTAGTSYTFYVRSYYAEGKYSAAINLAFSTACDVYDMPYAESFESAGKPLCWEVAEANWAETFSQGSTGNKWSNRYGSTTHQGNYALYYNSKTSTDNSADITMPRIAIDKAAKLLFYIKNNYEVTGEVRIAADEVETQVVALKTTGNNFNTLQEIDLNEAFVGKTVTITFHAQGVGTSENSSLAIDDIEIAQVCQKPANLAATATSDGAEVTWEGDEDQYQYCVVNSGNDPAGWVLLESEVKSVTITGKQVGKSYDVYVRAYCGAANQSAAVMTTFIPVENPTALDNSNAANKAVKLIENDQIVIIRDGVKYNAQGQKLN